MATHHQGSAVRPKISFNSSHPVPAVLKSGPKMTKNGCSLSMLLLYTIGKPMERKFQKIKKLMCPISFMPHPKIVPRP